MDVCVVAFTLLGNSYPSNSVASVDVGSNADIQCIGYGPPGTTFDVTTNDTVVSRLWCGLISLPPWNRLTCSMSVFRCGVFFEISCQAGYDVTTKKTIRVSSSRCSKLNPDLKNIRVDAFTLLGESVPLPSIVTAEVGRTLEFQCTGHGPPGTTFTISTNIPRANVTSSVQVNEGQTTVSANCVLSVQKCGVLFEVSCQAGNDVTTKKTIRVSSPECPILNQGSDNNSNSSKLIWPLTVGGIILALGVTCACLAYRVWLNKRRAARNAVSRGSETTTTSITASTTSLNPPHYVNVSYTNTSLESPYVAAAVSEHGSLPPSYSVVVRDAGKYKMPSAGSFLDRPPLYESLFNQQATQK